MFKNLKSIIPRKKQQNQDEQKQKESKKNKPPARPKFKPKFTAFQKIKETMGNLTTSMFHQHYIENVDEHSTKIMGELDRMRHNGTMCDVTMRKCDGTTIQAHKIVVSFNEKLLQIIEETPKCDEIKGESTLRNEPSGETVTENGTEIVNAEEKNCEIDESPAVMTSVASEEDLVKGLKDDDVIVRQVTEPPEPSEVPQEQQAVDPEQNSPEVAEKDENSTEMSTNGGPSDNDVTKGENNENDLESKSTQQDVTCEKENDVDVEKVESTLPTPLVTELAIDGATEHEETETSNAVISTAETKVFDSDDTKPSATEMKPTLKNDDVTIHVDGVTNANLYVDPVEILINFFYTSHINITVRNVEKLRAVAQQCAIDDVTMACDEFENVLRTETEGVNTEEEKEETAAKLRYQYSDPQMALKMLEHFEKLRHSGRHVDVTVKSPSTSFKYPAHSALLAASSKFFGDVLTDTESSDVINDDVNKNRVNEVEGPDVKDGLLQGILSYIYTAKIPVSSSSVKGMIDVANTINLEDVVEGCAEYLEGTLAVQNAIDLYQTAEKYQCSKLKGNTLKFIKKSFLTVCATNDFMTVTKEWLCDILSSNELQIDRPASESEYHIFQAVRKWVNFDLEHRKQEVYEVMSEVRIPLISDNRLINDISTDLLIMENDPLCKRVSGIITGKASCKFAEPVSMRGEEFVLMIGGSAPVVDETGDEQGYTAVAFSGRVITYDVENGLMKELTRLPETRSLHCAVAIDHYVIVAGGYDKYSCITNEVMCLDLANLTWYELPHMKAKRSCFVMVTHGGFIYAMGGLTPTGYSAKVERYNRDKMKWEYMSPMPKTYYRNAGCVYNNEIVLSGGNDKSTDALTYSPTEDTWRHLKPMNQGRDSHVMTSVMDRVYVMGGDIKILSTEEYNATTGFWQMLTATFREPVYFPGCTAFKDKIYLVGGWKGDDDAHDDVRCFDVASETWMGITTFLPFPCGSLTATTVRLPRSYFNFP